jgi:hypothetical protein
MLSPTPLPLQLAGLWWASAATGPNIQVASAAIANEPLRYFDSGLDMTISFVSASPRDGEPVRCPADGALDDIFRCYGASGTSMHKLMAIRDPSLWAVR